MKQNALYFITVNLSSRAILQKAQSKILRMITNASWCVSNLTLHEDLKIPYAREVIFEKYAKHHRKLETHPNPLPSPFTGHWAAKTTEEDPARGPAMR